MTHDIEAPVILAAPSPVDILQEIVGHLGSALIQTVPSDDQIIIGHVRSAHELATLLWHAARRAA